VEDLTGMADDKQVSPSQFKGKAGENAEDWFRHFENYCAYRGLEEAKKLALFKVLMTELAGDWLATLSDDTLGTFDGIKTAFDARYKTPEMTKYKSAKEIFTRKQQQGEPVEEYITKIQKAARVIGADEKTTVYAVLNGLRAEYVPYVTQSRPENIKALIDAARMAELTTPAPVQTDPGVSAQLAAVRDEIKEMNRKWQQLTVTPLKGEEEETAPGVGLNAAQGAWRGRRDVGYGPSQQQRGDRSRPYIQWQSQYSRGPTTFNQSWAPKAAGPQWNGTQSSQWPRQTWPGQSGPYNMMMPQQRMCRNCGRRSHDHPRQCPAVNQYCTACSRLGHYARCCLATARAMRAQGPGATISGNYSQ